LDLVGDASLCRAGREKSKREIKRRVQSLDRETAAVRKASAWFARALSLLERCE
jgi:hypothetical protein